MKRNRTIWGDDSPGERGEARQVHAIYPTPESTRPSNMSGLIKRIQILLYLLSVFIYLLIPSQSLAFGLSDIGKAFKDAAESVQQHLTNKTKEKVDKGQKQVEKAVDQTVDQKPNGSDPTAPAQQGTSTHMSAGQHPTAVGGSLQAQVHEELLGPYLTPLSGGRVFVSEEGGHVAISMKKGSRQVMLVDGKEGPLFDEVPAGGVVVVYYPPQFIPTGRHCAYVGRRGDQLLAVIDGKEVRLGTWGGPSSVSPLGNKNPLFFNQDGSRIAYLSFVAGSRNTYYLHVGGRKSKGFAAIDTTQIRFAGQRLAYPAQTADGKWHVVVDGKLGPSYEKVTSLQWSADGAHYAYAANTDGKHAQVVVDGGAGKVYTSATGAEIEALTFTADNRVAFALRGGTLGRGTLVVGGTEITHAAQPFEFGRVNPFLVPSREIAGSGAPWFAPARTERESPTSNTWET